MHITEIFLNFALLGAEWVMYILILCSIVNLAFILERFFIFFRLRSHADVFLSELSEKFKAKVPSQEILEWCKGKKGLEASVVKKGLQCEGEALSVAENHMKAAIISAKSYMSKRLTILGTLGNNTPFIGLFGTIIGIIQAFHALSKNDEGGATVMAAISAALVATAVALMVAIPAVMAYNFFTKLIKTKISTAEETMSLVLGYLATHK